MALEEIGVGHRNIGTDITDQAPTSPAPADAITWHGHQESFGLCAVRAGLVWTTAHDVVAVVTIVSATQHHGLRSVVAAGSISGTLATSLLDSVPDVPRWPLLLALDVTIALTYSRRDYRHEASS
jgi:hypothetical protein